MATRRRSQQPQFEADIEADGEDGPVSKPSLILLSLLALAKYPLIIYLIVICGLPVYAVAGRWTLFLTGERSILQYNYTLGMDTASLIIFLPTMFVMYGTAFACMTIACKWLVVFRYTKGFHAIGSFMYYRWSFMDTMFGVADVVFASSLRGTALLCLYYRLLGASVALDAIIDTTKITCHDLIEIRSGAVLLNDVSCRGETHVPDGLFMGKVVVGHSAIIGPRAMLMPLSEIPDGCIMPGMFKVHPNADLLSYTKNGRRSSSSGAGGFVLLLARTIVHVLSLGIFAFLSGFAVTAGVVVVTAINAHQGWSLGYEHLLMAPVGYVVAGLALWTLGVICKWTLIDLLGGFPIDEPVAITSSFFLLRKWFVDRFLALVYKYFILIFSGSPIPLLWLFSLGTRFRGIVQFEFLEMQYSEAGLLTIGSHSFWSAYSGVEAISTIDDDHNVSFDRIDVGANTFIGNHSVLAGGSSVVDCGLVADLTWVPPSVSVAGNKIAMGTPPDFILADRPASLGGERNWTMRLIFFQVGQLIFELYFIWLMIYLGIAAYRLFQVADANLGLWSSWQQLPGDTLLGVVPMRTIVVMCLPVWIIWVSLFLLVAILHKRALYGNVISHSFEDAIFGFSHARYWSFRIFIVALNRIFLNSFGGSPVASIIYSLLGVKIDLRTHIFGQQMLILEPDLLTIEEGVTIAPDTIIQCHNFAKGTLVVAPVTIAADSIVGEESVFGNNITVHNNVNIQPRSSILSGEKCDVGTLWSGSPASRVE